ncbi:hypothetical protein SEA_GAECEO_32 [Microbacterium phage GaeCeo]|nr:hypothetical protein SEA_GAECEO_32 [Microbacterium phage GaeCeo]
MNNTRFAPINPTFIEHEGFYYLEFEGEFYKGCRRCGGEGHYSHNGEHSRCYTCDNTAEKLGEHIGSDRAVAERWCHERAVRRAQRERKAQAKVQAAQDARDARVAALKATDPEVVALLQKTYDDENEAYATGDYRVIQRTNGFLRTMAGKLFNAGESGLTDNMVAAVRKFAASEAEKTAKAAETPVLLGRQVVTGEVISTKVKESDYGTSYKVVIRDDRGFRVYATLPTALADDLFDNFQGEGFWLDSAKGRRLQATYTITASDDADFGFGARPAKAVWL